MVRGFGVPDAGEAGVAGDSPVDVRGDVGEPAVDALAGGQEVSENSVDFGAGGVGHFGGRVFL